MHTDRHDGSQAGPVEKTDPSSDCLVEDGPSCTHPIYQPGLSAGALRQILDDWGYTEDRNPVASRCLYGLIVEITRTVHGRYTWSARHPSRRHGGPLLCLGCQFWFTPNDAIADAEEYFREFGARAQFLAF